MFLRIAERIPGRCCRIGCNEKTTSDRSTACLAHQKQKKSLDDRNRDIKRQQKNKRQRLQEAAANPLL